MHTGADMHTHTCARFTCTHMHTHAHMHICKLICVCVFGQTRYLLVSCASPVTPPLRGLQPPTGGMVEILVALSGPIGSGDCHLPQKHGFRFGSNGAGKPKGGTEQSSGLCLVDYQFNIMFIVVCLIVRFCWKQVSLMKRIKYGDLIEDDMLGTCSLYK